MAWENPILGEVRIVAGRTIPEGWALCDGRLLKVTEHQSLFSLLGTTYGGDGRTNFALPDLRGRVPVQLGQAHEQGQQFGHETHTLTIDEMATHFHTLYADADDVESDDPEERLLAKTDGAAYFLPSAEPLTMGPAIGTAGGGQGHDNMMPFTVLNYCIALQGDFPKRPDERE